MLAATFQEMVLQNCHDADLAEKCWQEIVSHYSAKERHYHSLTHLEDLYAELLPMQPSINDWLVMIFAIAYHDIVYDVPGKDNEVKSAAVATERLLEIGLTEQRIHRCAKMIEATASHGLQDDHDTNLFTDADLSILGKSEIVYKEYTRQIRKEYSFYPDLIYKPGRKKALKHFLNMRRIFKTDYFFERYEQQARINIDEELLLY